MKLSVAFAIFIGLSCLVATQILIWKPGGFDRHERMVKENLAAGKGLTGFWYLDFVVELFTIIDEEAHESLLAKFGAEHTFIEAGVAMLFVLVEAERENRNLKLAPLQLMLMICAAISFAFPALTIPLFQATKKSADLKKPAAATAFRTFLYCLLAVVATLVYTIRCLLGAGIATLFIKKLIAVFLGNLGLALLFLTFFSVVGFVVKFRASRSINASHYIIASYGILAGICVLMWWMSAIELYRHYSLFATNTVLDKMIIDSTINRSAMFLLIDVVGLGFGFLLFFASEESFLNTILGTVASIFISPATLFCYNRITAELEVLSSLQDSKSKKNL